MYEQQSHDDPRARSSAANASRCLIVIASVLIGAAVMAGAPGARASESEADHGYEIETEHLFGFTEGSDIGDKGEKSIEAQSLAGIGKASGTYVASSNGLQFKYTATDNFRIGVSPNFSYHSISGVPGLDNLTQWAFQGFSSELRYHLLDRATAPVGFTLSFEPEWSRVDDVSGESVQHYALGIAALIDKELVKDRTFAAVNLIYEPAWTRVNATGMWEIESDLEISAAITQQIISGNMFNGDAHFPHVFLGGEARYLRKSEGAALNTFAGNALFIGPTLCAVFSKHTHLTLAWSAQVAGKSVGEPGSLDLVDFGQNQVRALFEMSF